MLTLRRLATTLAVLALGTGLSGCGGTTHDRSRSGSGSEVGVAQPPPPPPPGTVASPRPRDQAIAHGLAWLARNQLPGGSWGQGDEAQTMGGSGAAMRDTASVADTSMALLAFLRAGHTAKRGEYREVVRRGLEFVIAQVEAADSDSLRVTSTQGTRVQTKIGPYVDTFAALMLLEKARGTMADGVANVRLERAVKKVLAKVEKNQRDNGTWDERGWAPVLSQAMAASGLNRAAQAGLKVNQLVLDRVEKRVQAQFDFADESIVASPEAAGVDLYSGAAATITSKDAATTRKKKVEQLRKHGGKPRTDAPQAPGKDQALAAAEAEAEVSAQAAAKVEGALLARIDDPSFIRGFGSNGGEEFLSYVFISDSLVTRRDEHWRRWDEAISKLVTGVQNEDGSWTGHHCITGRTFCTAAALLLLLAESA